MVITGCSGGIAPESQVYLLAVQFGGSRHECQYAGVLALGRPHIEQLTAFVVCPFDTGLQFVCHEVRIAGFQTLAQACDASIWPLSLLLHDHGARGNDTAVAHIPDAQLHQVAGSQFAVDRQIEQGKLAGSVCDLEADANRPDIL